MIYWIYIILNIYLNEIYFCLNYDLIYIYDFRQSDYVLTLIPSQWGLFIGTLIPKPMGVIHWYSDVQSREYSVTIVIRLLKIWITFQCLNYFESLKLHMWFWKCLSIWTILSHSTAYVFLEPFVRYSFWYMENWLLSKPSMIYL